ncbi:hypothetical protein [Winogradskyella vidalii]|uniref:hypothetical protein n=1 Tax=Winogradskyella vidalii TaxID=2615024 RepID=UPI0015CDB21B|nr:hypothetical protein [Winogradskyella vidalii]
MSNSLETNESIIIERHSNSEVIIVAFGGIQNNIGMPIFEFFNIMKDKPYTKVFVKDNQQSWYHKGIEGSDDINTTVILLKKILTSLDYLNKKVVFVGNSAGGYAAIVFGVLLEADKVLAFAPQTFLGKWKRFVNREKRWKNESNYMLKGNTNPNYFLDLASFFKNNSLEVVDIEVYYAMDSVSDMKHYKNIKDLSMTFHLYPKGGHSLIKELKLKGILNNSLNYI